MTPALRRWLAAAVPAIVVLAASSILDTPASTQGRRPRFQVERINGHDAVAGEVLVKFRRALDELELEAFDRSADADRHHPVGGAGVRLVRSRSQSAAALVAMLRAHPDVLFVEPNYVLQALAPPDDPGFPQLWGLRNIGQAVNGGAAGTSGADIHAEAAWDVSTGSRSNVVAVLDTGIDYTHPDLAANIWAAPAAFTVTLGGASVVCQAGTHGVNVIARTCDPMDDHSHGTHVSGTVGGVGNNGIGVAGVNWTASIIGAKFLDADGSGSVADAVDAIEFLISAKQTFAATGAANVRVLSASWGGNEFSQALFDEIARAYAHDMLFVAAAGNTGLPNEWFPTYPATFDIANIIAVAATTNTDARAWFSNYGTTTVDLGAPGVDVYSTLPHNGYGFASGTSMATPHVSGAAALVLSACSLDTDHLRALIVDTVDPVSGLAAYTITGGRLNVDKAVRACTAIPGRPSDLKAAGGNGQVTLTWVAAPGAITYMVRRSTTSGGPYAALATDVRTTSYTDSTVVNDTTYYYVVSGANMLGQGDDSNEASATPRIPPDLVVSAMAVPARAGAGLPLTISVTTANQGAGAAPPSTTRLYLSANYTLDAADAMLDGAQAVPALAAGTNATASVQVTVPAGTVTGTSYIIAKADAGGDIVETSDTNNTRWGTTRVGPDVFVSAMTVPAAAAAGGTIVVQDSVKNQGGGVAATFVTRFYLSANAAFDAADTVLDGSRSVGELQPDQTSSGSTTVSIPAGTATGAYYVVARADADDAVKETTETNNTAARQVKIGPDLVVSSFVAPTTAGAGSSIVVTDSVKNQGSGAAGASATRFYLSLNYLLDASDALLAVGRDVPALAPGATSSGSATLTVPADTAAGTYYLFAKADGDAQVAETQETNNTRSAIIRVGPDLSVSSLLAPATAEAGGTVTVSDTVRNQGAGSAGSSSTWFYLSANLTLDAADVLLGGTRTVPALAAGATHSGSTVVTVPGGTATGTYYLFAKADGGNDVAETAETNNTSLRSVRVGPDLTVSFVSAASSVVAGASLVVVDTVKNQGMGLAGASITRYYLSSDFTLDGGDLVLEGSRAVPALGTAAVSTGQTTMIVPGGTAAGTYYLFAKTDADAAVVEAVETNNTAIRILRVSGS
jgi:subtilisin family serine protease/subtilase family serine protease